MKISLTPPKQAKLQIITYACAIWFLILGSAFMFVPTFAKLFGLEIETAHIIGGVLFIMTIFYMLIAPLVAGVLEKAK